MPGKSLPNAVGRNARGVLRNRSRWERMPSVCSVPRLLLLAAVLGCVPPAPADSGSASVTSPLVASLTVAPAADGVRLVLQVTNAGTAPLRLAFTSGQRYDFSVLAGERSLWTWSADRGFILAVGEETLAPGETRTYTETWVPPPGTRGELTAVATLTSATHPVERTTTFRLP